VGEAVLDAARIHFAARLGAPHFALSLDIVENDPALSWKLNSIHPRLRGKSA
jgi:5-carboxymethyl-2-hydroxymuconate isomerase